ncbi:MAG TPA: hypothetical protein VG734_20735 [Lacunisphaera sp.]|nr:hypothetical protein [Lacunisphaera sp.]
MSTLPSALVSVLLCWAFYRLALWQSKRGLDKAIETAMSEKGLQLSPELTALLRRPTVDGVARKILQKRGLCVYADWMVRGETVTLVCHDNTHLNHVLKVLAAKKDEIEALMRLESFKAAATPKKFTPPPLADGGAATADVPPPFTVIEGDKR